MNAKSCVLVVGLVTLLAMRSIGVAAGAPGDRIPGTADKIVPVVVTEAGAGDLNGDGDTADMVVHIVDAKSGASVNLGLAVSTVCRATNTPPFVDCRPVEPLVSRTAVAFLVDERAQGELDLNGDGDADDDVLYVYEEKTRQIMTTALAVAHGVGRDVSSYIFPIAPVLTEKLVVVLVSEAESGGVDLNGDTDTADAVFHVIDVKTHTTTNLALAAATVVGPFGSRNPVAPELDGQKLILTVSEINQGDDLNRDGDIDDEITFVLHQDEVKVAKP